MRTRTLDTLAAADRLRPVLLRIARELRREAQAETGVSPGQIALLAAIKYEPGISLGDLATRERMSAPGMTRSIDRLEKAGLVTRTQSSDDRRRVGLTLTEEGQRVLRRIRSRRTAWLAQRLEQLTPADRAAVEGAIDSLEKLLDGEKKP
jgi:DNA-binding MarR family transcriptional regulator